MINKYFLSFKSQIFQNGVPFDSIRKKTPLTNIFDIFVQLPSKRLSPLLSGAGIALSILL